MKVPAFNDTMEGDYYYYNYSQNLGQPTDPTIKLGLRQNQSVRFVCLSELNSGEAFSGIKIMQNFECLHANNVQQSNVQI